MATYKHGKDAAVLHGGFNLQPWIREATATMALDVADTSHQGSTSKTYILGQNDATFSAEGLYDGTLNGIEDIMEAAIANELAAAPASIPITFAPEGLVHSGIAFISAAKVTTYEVNPVISDVVSMSFEMQANGGMAGGQILFAATPISATTAGASIDYTNTSNTGALVAAHILSNANTGNVTVTLQHSTNNSTWVDLVTLPVVATGNNTAYRFAELAAGTTINRYLRINVTLAGTGAVSVLASAARK